MTTSTQHEHDKTACCSSETADSPTTEAMVYCPDVDILETDSSIELVFDMPGVDEKSLEISVDKEILSLTGHTRISGETNTGEAEYEMLYNEYQPGDYHRLFRLPGSVDSRQVEATIKQGVLHVSLPKVKPQTVAVKAV